MLLGRRRVVEREPAPDLARPRRPAVAKPGIVGAHTDVDALAEAAVASAGGTVRTQSSNGRQVGRRGVDHGRPAGDLIAERAEHHEHVDVGAQPWRSAVAIRRPARTTSTSTSHGPDRPGAR